MSADRAWHIVRTVELGAPAREVWKVVGGFYTIHTWHPDIELTEIPEDQSAQSALRRILTFPGQPKTTEELILIDNQRFLCRYKWHSGSWGERVRNYVADIRLFDLPETKKCSFQWSSTFNYYEDAISEFYYNGFHKLLKQFPVD